jgi:hypothetical protein
MQVAHKACSLHGAQSRKYLLLAVQYAQTCAVAAGFTAGSKSGSASVAVLLSGLVAGPAGHCASSVTPKLCRCCVLLSCSAGTPAIACNKQQAVTMLTCSVKTPQAFAVHRVHHHATLLLTGDHNASKAGQDSGWREWMGCAQAGSNLAVDSAARCSDTLAHLGVRHSRHDAIQARTQLEVSR